MPDPLEELRRLGFSIAYRMLGSVAEAEEILQEAFLRFHAEAPDVRSPKSWFTTVVTRLAIDHLRSARVRREQYFGTWLPEPIVTPAPPDAEHNAELAETLSIAMLTLLETLSPAERAVFILREAFDFDYEEIAGVVDKTPENCRQILTRARRNLEARRPRFEPSREERETIATRFWAACATGNLDDLVSLLSEQVVFEGDGGGRTAAVAHPIAGPDRVAKLMLGLARKGAPLGVQFRAVEVNGEPGALFLDAEGRVISVMALEIADGQVQAIRSIVNPDKLAHLGPRSPLVRLTGPRA